MTSNFKQEVLAAFQKKSPSAIEIENERGFSRYESNLKNLFHNKLNFPQKMFDNSMVIDFGCGTGEVDVVLSKWGATVEGFDFNEISIERANFLRETFSLGDRLTFKVGDVDQYPIQSEAFDLAISMGVIAHVPNQEKMFERMAHACKRGGFVVIGYVESSGLVQRLMHRAICKVYAEGNEKKVYEIAQSLFGEHIARSVQYGGRTAESVINDYLVNPHYLGLRFGDLLKWQDKYGLEFYSMTPSVIPPFSVDSAYHPSLVANTPIFQIYISLMEIRWIFSQAEDRAVLEGLLGPESGLKSEVDSLIENFDGLLNQYDFVSDRMSNLKRDFKRIEYRLGQGFQRVTNEVLKNYSELTTELTTIMEMLINQKKNGKDLGPTQRANKLFKGYNGLTTSYIIFHKPHDDK